MQLPSSLDICKRIAAQKRLYILMRTCTRRYVQVQLDDILRKSPWISRMRSDSRWLIHGLHWPSLAVVMGTN